MDIKAHINSNELIKPTATSIDIIFHYAKSPQGLTSQSQPTLPHDLRKHGFHPNGEGEILLN